MTDTPSQDVAHRKSLDQHSPGTSAPAIRKYGSELRWVKQFAESTKEGRRCQALHRADTEWCVALRRHLDAVRCTRNGGPETEKNPKRQMAERTKVEILRRFNSVIQHAMLRSPRLVPSDFRNPMPKGIIAANRREDAGPSEPPVSIDALVEIVPRLDVYSLGLLAPEIYYGPRPSELGHLLTDDHDPATGMLTVRSRPATG